MLCLSGFELYCRWVPLKCGSLTDCVTYHSSDLPAGRDRCFPSQFYPPGFQID